MLLTEFDQRIWDPFEAISEIRNEMGRLFRDRAGVSYGYPAVNLWKAEKDVIVTAELPGITAEDVNISTDGRTLTLEGERKREGAQESDAVRFTEFAYGAFRRTLELPFRVDPARVKADYSKGILSITLPRADEDLPKRIEVKAA